MSKKKRVGYDDTASLLSGVQRHGYTDYRYGSDRPVWRPGQPRPNFSKDRRERLIEKTTEILKSWEYSPFEHEADCRNGIRRGFCAEGVNWQPADDIAAYIVAEGLRNIHAKRPTWAEGQCEWTYGPDNRRWCGVRLPDELMLGTRKNAYCCPEHAKLAFQQREFESRTSADKVYAATMRMVMRARQEPRKCAECGKSFRPMRADSTQKFCSEKCAHDNDRKLPDHICPTCHKTFRPRIAADVYCSMECYRARTVTKLCQWCLTPFEATSEHAEFCCRPHMVNAHRARTGYYRKISPKIFDYLFVALRPPRRQLTPAAFDALLMVA